MLYICLGFSQGLNFAIWNLLAGLVGWAAVVASGGNFGYIWFQNVIMSV